ncbi:MAG: prepilin-type N-terminal cleavage/methylation domain-containing protein [Pseudomonadota bacterium]|nr:prepilin-type cleavage/methylation domain-containing protein [Pseudomonadales bacterium]MDY6920198.1 prepilin-type N-terminal cleavage/methylation domain-containing protein [Pseudomonadota bacterium]
MQRDYHSGFTLIELITVITIIGVLAVVVGPRFSSSTVFEERTFFDDLAQAVRYTQAKAMGTGCLAQIAFTTNGFTVTVDSDCNSSAFSGVAVTNPDGFATGYTERQALPAGSSVSASVNPLLFDPQGRALNSSLNIVPGNAQITVGSRTLRVAGATGYVYQP